MKDQPLLVKAKCKGGLPCLFEGREVFFEIEITNVSAAEVGFPLDYVRKTGPIIQLIDARTKATTYLKANLADPSLKEKLTIIQPEQSVVFEWVITSGELEQFGDIVDLSAEITIMEHIKVEGRKFEFRGSDTLGIVTHETP